MMEVSLLLFLYCARCEGDSKCNCSYTDVSTPLSLSPGPGMERNAVEPQEEGAMARGSVLNHLLV